MTTTAAPLDSPTLAPATPDVVDRVAEAMRANGIEAIVVDSAEEARAAVLERIPEGAEVHSGKSKTIEDIGLFNELMESDRFDFIRRRLFKMDRATQGREMRKLGASPDFEL